MRALMIIDVQQGMFGFPESPPYDGEAVVARIANLLGRARTHRTPVFFVQHDGGPGDLLAAGGPGFPFRAELTPRTDEPVTVKRHRSAFHGTDLEDKLRRAGIDELIVCGMQSEYCVDTAVRAAVERGFRVTLVSDGHTTFNNTILPAAQIIAHHNATLGDPFSALKRADEIKL